MGEWSCKKSTPDRLVVGRKTPYGLEPQVEDFLDRQGYELNSLEQKNGEALIVESNAVGNSGLAESCTVQNFRKIF